MNLLDIVIFTITTIFLVTIIIDEISNIAHPYLQPLIYSFNGFASFRALARQLGFTNQFIFAGLAHTVEEHLTFLIDVLIVLLVQSTSVMTTLLNEITDIDYSHAETSISPFANATPAVINTAVNIMAPPTHPAYKCRRAPLLGPMICSSLRPLIL